MAQGVEREELTEKWREQVTNAVGAAEGLREYCDQFIEEAKKVLHEYGCPYPFGAELLHFHDYRNTPHEIIEFLDESMKVWREYIAHFGGENLTRCDCCDLFKPDCQDYPDPDGEKPLWLCSECAEGLNEKEENSG